MLLLLLLFIITLQNYPEIFVHVININLKTVLFIKNQKSFSKTIAVCKCSVFSLEKRLAQLLTSLKI